MGQLQAKPARLRAVSLLLRFSEGNACQCKSCHFHFSGISLGGVRKKREMLIVDRPAEVLNFEQKQHLAIVVFFIFML